MKFGKYIQKKQLDIPEYAASFVDYKALKKVIKGLKNSPAIAAEAHLTDEQPSPDAQNVLQANKAPFFFRLDRELDKVNAFYTVKEKESKVRLRVLIDKQRSMRLREPNISKNSTYYITLEQGFRDFIKDLSKLQQFIEINATAFSKILKKWDKTSKSQMKELYLARAVEVQPCFNHDVISELSDQANAALLDCAAWTEGDRMQYGSEEQELRGAPTPRLEQDETDADLLEALNKNDLPALRALIKTIDFASNGADRLTKAYLTAVAQAPEEALRLLLDTGLIDLNRQDEINARNCLHKTAMSGRLSLLQVGLAAKVDPARADAYGRIPLHYACMNGHHHLIQPLVESAPNTVDMRDLDNFSALIHSIVHARLECVEQILSYSARVDADKPTDHLPLNLACQYGSAPIVQLLLTGGPRIMPDAEGLYPQHLVARFGRDPQLLLMLSDYGADLDQPDKLYQWTPLFHAASEGRTACLQTLLECGVNPNTNDEKSLSALYYATWEGHLKCMSILQGAMRRSVPQQQDDIIIKTSTLPPIVSTANISQEIDVIPDLSLPPPIIPTRRYGHNFLDTKTTIVISFDHEPGKNAVTFYDETKYPAARLTIAPRSSDMLPRNILLPIQDDSKYVSFEMANFDTFALDFDVYPTFGKKVIAKGSAPPEAFKRKESSSGSYDLSLFDPRLRTVGQMSFKFQVIRPYAGAPLDITPFATYWKATSQLESQPSSLVTGSSLSGEYIRVPVQLSKDNVPVLHPEWTVEIAQGCGVSLARLTVDQYLTYSRLAGNNDVSMALSNYKSSNSRVSLGEELSHTAATLSEVLSALPQDLQLNLHLLFPTPQEEEQLGLGPTANINTFADSLLNVVFEDARQTREASGNTSMRSLVFTSSNKDLCSAMNWKQPNYPVLLANDLGAPHIDASHATTNPDTSLSIKEAVRIAQLNNFMGLLCRSEIFDTVPSLIHTIKVAGLVLVSDNSSSTRQQEVGTASLERPPEGIDGVLQSNGILRFNETVDA